MKARNTVGAQTALVCNHDFCPIHLFDAFVAPHASKHLIFRENLTPHYNLPCLQNLHILFNHKTAKHHLKKFERWLSLNNVRFGEILVQGNCRGINPKSIR